MLKSIRSLNDLPEDDLVEYLSRQGISPELTRWKYFDSAFNRNRERGLAWVRNGRIAGFIGIIPFVLGREGESREAIWTCDWSVENHEANPGIGVLLLKRVLQSYDPVLVLGGNEHTRSIMPRIATHTEEDGGRLYRIPLSMEAVIKKLGERLPFLNGLQNTPVRRIPLRRMREGALESQVRSVPGVSEVIAPLLEEPQARGWHPRYDHAYVHWMIGRCPILNSDTCYLTEGGEPAAAAVLWRLKDSPGLWRMAFWSRPGAEAALAATVSAAARHAYRNGAMVLSTLLSSRDDAEIRVMRSGGFADSGFRNPLFVCTSDPEHHRFQDVHRLSFLDTDLSYLI